jgi:hypothetical protein
MLMAIPKTKMTASATNKKSGIGLIPFQISLRNS